MSQDFYIVNRECQQYINPFHFPAHHRCPTIIMGSYMQGAITFLTTRSTNPDWVSVRESSSSTTKRLLGTWTSGAEILGSYAEESALHYAQDCYENISLQCIIMLIDMGHQESRHAINNLAEHGDWLDIAERIIKFDKEFLVPYLARQFGEHWEKPFYELMGNRWVRQSAKRKR